MCVSASVSYGSAALLFATGTVATLGNPEKSQRMAAAIPFLFGVQQAAEGLVWQTLGDESTRALHMFAAYGFLVFANAIWPAWIPWSFYYLEENKKRKRILKYFGIMGLIVFALAAYVLFTTEVTTSVNGHSLSYGYVNLKRFWPANLDIVLYFIPTVLAFFVSSLHSVRWAGYLVFGSLLLAQIINQETTASVWCFFAALISLFVTVNVLWRQRGQVR